MTNVITINPGSGTLDRRGSANTYTGTTTVLTGSVLIDDGANLGTAPASAAVGHLEMQGATLYANTTAVPRMWIRVSS